MRANTSVSDSVEWRSPAPNPQVQHRPYDHQKGMQFCMYNSNELVEGLVRWCPRACCVPIACHWIGCVRIGVGS